MAIVMIFLLLNFEYNGYFGIDPLILKSIAVIESGEKIQIKHLNKNGTIDYGLMQINTFWVNRLHLDTLKLIHDPDYSIFWAAYILKMCFKRYGFTIKGLGCYHGNNEKA